MSRLTDQELTELYHRHVAMVYRVCFAYMKQPDRTQDAVQETFIRALTRAPQFEGPAHEVAWLVRTATNVCKDSLKTWWRRQIQLDSGIDQVQQPDIDTTLQAVLDLPDKYKSVVYLYYYEGYPANEIAQLLGRPASTVRNHLAQARQLLRSALGDFDEKP